MSDCSEENHNDKDGNICRDFLRGMCDRKSCKYKHENETRPLNFCHDFQNNICPRPHCKFIHCAPEEVEIYNKTGEMSNRILAEATRKNQLPGVPPVCNQFRKGLCRRSNCKFRHLTKEQEEEEIMSILKNNIQRRQLSSEFQESQQFMDVGFISGINRRSGVSFDEYQDLGLPFAKRKFSPIDGREMLTGGEIIIDRPIFKGYFAGNPPTVLNTTLLLEEENGLLHKEIAKLKKQVQDLTATNEFLLDQNANLRMSTKQNLPSVSITSTNAPQQMIGTVPASVATVPVSLATVSTCNPVTIAGCSTVSIASPAQILNPSQQILVTTNPAQQLALATSTQQLTSQQAQHMTSQHLALAASAAASQQLTTQQQQLTLAGSAQTHQQLNQQHQQLNQQHQQLNQQHQQLNQAQQLANQQLTSQAQQLALAANTTQQLTSQAQQLALANTTQQLTSQAQHQLATALATTPQQLTVTSVQPQQITLASTNQQLLAAQQSLAASTQQIELHRSNQINTINTSQTIAMSNTTQPMVSYPMMTQNMSHGLAH